jgi:predicted NBD/HSP70 family sugar kinase
VWLPMLSPNERRVLDLILRQGPIARANIGPLLDLTSGSVTRLTQELWRDGLIVEVGNYRSGSRGTPSKPLVIDPAGAYAFGVSFSHTYMDVGLVDLAGNLLGSIRRSYEQARPEILRENARAAIEELEAQFDVAQDRVQGIGFAVPGDFSATKPYIVAHAFFPFLEKVDLVSVFAEGMRYPVFIENDCNCAAMGERLAGHGLRYNSFVSVSVCHGIGGGVIIDGTLHRGTHGNAGGLHAFFPMSQPRPSGHDLFDALSREGVAVRDFCDLEAPDAIDFSGIRPWLHRSGKQLRDALGIVARVLDPDAVVIGGRLPPPLLHELTRQIDDGQFCISAPTSAPTLLASDLGSDAGVVGAAAMVLYKRFFDRGEDQSLALAAPR